MYMHSRALILRFFSVLLQKLDEAAVEGVFKKSLENYIKWCEYLCIQPVWSRFGLCNLFLLFSVLSLVSFYIFIFNHELLNLIPPRRKMYLMDYNY